MRRLLPIVFLCGAALCGVAPASAQNKILPKQFRNWTLTKCVEQAPRLILADETGQREYEVCSYSAGDKSVGIRLGLYRDPTSAYELFTSRLRPGQVPTKLGQVAAFDKDGVVVQEGSLVLESTANISREDLTALISALEAKNEKSPLPPIRTYLPLEGRLVGTERYAMGPEALRRALAEAGQPEMPALVEAIGFSKVADAEAMLAQYSGNGKESGVLLLLEYPTPNVAEQRIHHLDEVLPESARQGETGIVRKGSLLALVLSASSPEYAKRLREAADYETQVTWNEASQAATDPPWSIILKRIFIGTGIFMIAAIILGIAFGGFRVMIKRFFPGKVFDRPERLEVLQLGLSGKRIDPSDFY